MLRLSIFYLHYKTEPNQTGDFDSISVSPVSITIFSLFYFWTWQWNGYTTWALMIFSRAMQWTIRYSHKINPFFFLFSVSCSCSWVLVCSSSLPPPPPPFSYLFSFFFSFPAAGGWTRALMKWVLLLLLKLFFFPNLFSICVILYSRLCYPFTWQNDLEMTSLLHMEWLTG